MRVYEFLSESTKWTQGAVARNSAGERLLSPFSLHATQWDVLGAIHFCYAERQQRMEIKFKVAYHLRRAEHVPAHVAIAGLHSVVKVICDWNDHHTTTHFDILDVLTTLEI